MKGKILSIITAILFGATMVAAPVVYSADATGTGTEVTKPAKTKKSKKKATAKKAPKKSKKKAPKTDTGA